MSTLLVRDQVRPSAATVSEARLGLEEIARNLGRLSYHVYSAAAKEPITASFVESIFGTPAAAGEGFAALIVWADSNNQDEHGGADLVVSSGGFWWVETLTQVN